MRKVLDKKLAFSDIDGAMKVRNVDRWLAKLQRKRTQAANKESRNSSIEEIEEEDEEDSFSSDSEFDCCNDGEPI